MRNLLVLSAAASVLALGGSLLGWGKTPMAPHLYPSGSLVR